MKRALITAGLAAFAATAGLAHQGVQNPIVLARMEGMSTMAEDVEVIGNMARGIAPLDAAAANAALSGIADEATRIVDLFELPEMDPRSEARPLIWDNYADFGNRAMELELAAAQLTGSIEDRESLTRALRRVGALCSGCHEDYRLDRD